MRNQCSAKRKKKIIIYKTFIRHNTFVTIFHRIISFLNNVINLTFRYHKSFTPCCSSDRFIVKEMINIVLHVDKHKIYEKKNNSRKQNIKYNF